MYMMEILFLLIFLLFLLFYFLYSPSFYVSVLKMVFSSLLITSIMIFSLPFRSSFYQSI